MIYSESEMIVKSNMNYLGKRIKIFSGKMLFYFISQIRSEYLFYWLVNGEKKQVYLSGKLRE